MAMVVKNNMSAVRTLNTLNQNTSALQKSLQKVSSGMKINSAQDDASGYAISERMRVRIRSLDQANQNTQNDASLMKTAEGAVGNTVEILRALKEKAINAANDSNTDEDRQTIQKEINQFIDQIDDNALVQFNGKYLVDGSKNNAFQETKTILLNQSLQTGTTSASALTNLNNRAGDSLSIQKTDQYQVSWVQNGTIHFTSGVVNNKTIADILTIKDDDGKVISEISATAENGLISGAKEIDDPDNTPYNKPETYVESDSESLATLYAAAKDAGLAANSPIVISDLTDSDGNQLFASNSDGKPFTTQAVSMDADGNITTNLTEGQQVFNLNSAYEAPKDTTTVAYKVLSIPSTGLADTTTGLPSSISGAATNDLLNTKSLTATELTALKTAGTIDADAEVEDLTFVDKDGNAFSDDYKFAVTNGNIKVRDASNNDVAVDLYVKNKNYVKTEGEQGLTKAWDKFGKAVYTPDKTDGMAFGANFANVDNQISGLTISILDQDGNVKKAANAALDQFKQYQRAENQTGDMSLNFHIGSEANVSFKVGMGDMRSQALGLKGSDGTRIDVYTKEHANAAINVIENALTKALDQQTTIGAIEARLEYTSTNLTTSSENVQAAESTIRDADMAKEMTNYTKSNVLLQAAQAMLAQANQNSSAVLSLLQ